VKEDPGSLPKRFREPFPSVSRQGGTSVIGKLTDALIECAKLKASTEFYVEKLGFMVQAQGQGWVCLATGGASITMWQGPNPHVIIGFTGADLAKVKAELATKGIDAGGLMEHPGGQHYYLTDPDGNVVMVADR
jgi:catechol-2,3-dioxygenase